MHTLVFPLLQTYVTFTFGVAYFLYAYARPYKTTFVNIIEIALLAYLRVFLTLAQGIHQQILDKIQLNETSVDSCGKALPPIGPGWIVLGVLFFLPVTVLLFLLGRWLLCVGQKCWYVILCACVCTMLCVPRVYIVCVVFVFAYVLCNVYVVI